MSYEKLIEDIHALEKMAERVEFLDFEEEFKPELLTRLRIMLLRTKAGDYDD